jgi:hypothetical protein
MMFANLSCKKENEKCELDNFYWSASIKGANYCYSTPTSPSTDAGKAILTNTSPGISTSVLVLSDNEGYPSLRFFGNGITLSEGTFVTNSLNSVFFTVLLSPEEYYTTQNIPDAHFTMHITSFGEVGSYVEGTFTGKAGILSSKGKLNYVDVSGDFKAFRAR